MANPGLPAGPAAATGVAGGAAKDAPMPALMEPPTAVGGTNGARQYRDASMSDEAFGLINRFYDGIDDVIRDLAERIALRDGSFLPDDPEVLNITTDHVQEAGRRIAELCRGSELVGTAPSVSALLRMAERPRKKRRGWRS